MLKTSNTKPTVAVVKYNAGNVRSVLFALERLGVEAFVTDEPDILRNADRVIFPGVGEARSAMDYLKQKKLDVLIKSLTQPVLGICLGMQLMCAHSEENDTSCLGIFGGNVRMFDTRAGVKVPQIGWNDIYDLKTPAFNGIAEHSFVYFVHSYYLGESKNAIGMSHYGIDFVSIVQKENIFGIQPHPEKSHNVGLKILKNFVKL